MRRSKSVWNKENGLMTGALAGCLTIAIILMSLQSGLQIVPFGNDGETKSIRVLRNESGFIALYENGTVLFSSFEALGTIQSAINNATNGTVKLGPGNFELNSTLSISSNISISGEGSKTRLSNGTIEVADASNISISRLSFENTSTRISAISRDIDGISLKEIDSRNCSSSAFEIGAEGFSVSNLKVIECSATKCKSSGFVLDGTNGSSSINNVSFDSCVAADVGIGASQESFAAGFDIGTGAIVSDVTMSGCRSNASWDSGFYFSEDSNKSDILLRNCNASYSGMNPNYLKGYGFYFDGNVTLEDCSGEGNVPALVRNISRDEPAAPDPEPTVEILRSELGLSFASTSVYAGEIVHGYGYLRAANGSGIEAIPFASVHLSIMANYGSSAILVYESQLTTDMGGQFAFDFIPSTPGTYGAAVAFGGDSGHEPTSNEAAFAAYAFFTHRVLPDGRVFDVNGNLVYGAEVTTSINWAISQGGYVYLPSGTYSIVGNIQMRSGATLFGDGDSSVINFVQTGLVYMLNVDNIALMKLKIVGNGGVYIELTGGAHYNYLIQDITSYQAANCDAAYHVWLTGGSSINNLRFIRCSAIEPRSHGFVTNGDKSGIWANNVYYEDCSAQYCGVNGNTNPWACGFVLAENLNVNGLSMIRCNADHNYESGFHFECDTLHYNTVFQYCSASYNGAHKVSPTYGVGFLLGAQSQLGTISGMETCTGTGNVGGLIMNCPGI